MGRFQPTVANGTRVKCEIHRCRSGWGVGGVGEREGERKREGEREGEREGLVFLCPTISAILGPIRGDVCSVTKSSCRNDY